MNGKPKYLPFICIGGIFTSVAEVKNSHQNTWGYTEDDPAITGYINELTGKVYYRDVTAKDAKTIAFTMGEYDFEDKKELQGGELVKEGQEAVGWKEPDNAEVINKAIVGVSKNGDVSKAPPRPHTALPDAGGGLFASAFTHVAALRKARPAV